MTEPQPQSLKPLSVSQGRKIGTKFKIALV